MIDINPYHLEIVTQILLEHVPDCEVRAFGSRATWTSKEYSDLDLAIVGNGPLKWRTLGKLRDAFEESYLPFRVDVLDWHDISDNFREIIEADCITVRESEKTTNSAKLKWPMRKFGDCATLIRASVDPSSVGDIPYIGLEHIGEGTLSLLGHGVASDVTSTKTLFKQGDILFGKLRPYFRKVVRAPFDGVCSTDIWTVRAKEGIDQGYLYYCMASQPFVDFATSGSIGTRMPRAKWEYISQYNLPVPTLNEQREIAHILESLDDKIELNRRMNETLEAMAQALFKSWFVDFNPVRAKMEGRWRTDESLPGLPAHFYDLFPNRLVPSELGDIPEGWKVQQLGEVIELAYGKSLKADKRNRGLIPVYGSNGQVGWHNRKLVDGPGIIVGRKGNPGMVKLSYSDFFPIDTTFYVISKFKKLSLTFLYFSLASQDLPSISSDSAVPGLNRELAYMNRQLIPNQKILKKFEHQTNEILIRRYLIEEETHKIGTIRDSLLTKLI